jgi:hypothetical protein
LGASQIVGAIGVEYLTVVTDFVKKIIGHGFSERWLAVAEQPEQDKVTIPAVHFVETPAWDDIRIGKVE